MKNVFLGEYIIGGVLSLLLLAGGAFGASAPLDFDDDGKTDIYVQRINAERVYSIYILQSRDGFRAFNSDVPLSVPADYDGDGKADLTFLRSQLNNQPLFWTIVSSRDNTTTTIQWGLSYDKLVPQDYDGDGKTDLAVYRAGTWYIRRSSDNQLYAEQFGRSVTTGDDVPFAGGDYDGDGKADLAVIRYTPPNPAGTPIPTTMFLRLSRDGTWASYNLGNAQSTGVLSGDYDGDGRADVAIWRGNEWLWIRSSDNQLGGGIRFGNSFSDRPAIGDYDGDGKTDPAVYRADFPQSYFYTQQSRDGFKAIPWGLSNDGPGLSIGIIAAIGF